MTVTRLRGGGDSDESFFEGSLVGTKTSKGREKLLSFLPLVIPLDGLSGLDWWNEFGHTRTALGLADLPSWSEANERDHDGALPLLLPAKSMPGQPAVSADETSVCLLDALSTAGFDGLATRNIASHSLKASWLTILG